jgi:hypothetical protein
MQLLIGVTFLQDIDVWVRLPRFVFLNTKYGPGHCIDVAGSELALKQSSCFLPNFRCIVEVVEIFQACTVVALFCFCMLGIQRRNLTCQC